MTGKPLDSALEIHVCRPTQRRSRPSYPAQILDKARFTLAIQSGITQGRNRTARFDVSKLVLLDRLGVNP